MTKKSETSLYHIYKRLFRYLLKYKARVVIGVIAGVFAASSIFSLLQVSHEAIKPFESNTVIESKAEEGEATKKEEKSSVAKAIDDIAAKVGVPATDDKGVMTWQFMIIMLLVMTVVVAFRAFAIYINRYYMRWVAARVVRDLRDNLFERLGSQSLKFFGRCDVGQLISRCTNDTTILERVLAVTVGHITRAPIEIFISGLFIIIFSVNNNLIMLIVALLLAFPLLVVPIVLLGHYVKRYVKKALESISVLVSRMHENFTGIKVVKAFHMEQKELQRFQDMNRGYFKSMVKAMKAELLMTPFMEAVAITMVGIFLVVCYIRGVTLSEIIPIGLASVIAYKPIKQLAKINAELQRGSAALERIFSIIDVDTALKEADDPVVKKDFKDKIVFDSVSLRYEDEGDMTVADVSFDIPKGSVVAVVGETGSGKTTLANLLARFYDPDKGVVLMDGVDLKDVKLESLRNLIGIVTQETILFNDTVGNNISYGVENASHEAVVEAAKKANADEFIMSSPESYDRVVGEKGCMLSGGEKQRVAIARAILRNPPILILDEATSALDTITERLVQEAIAHVMEDRTVFAIAHRLSTVKHADLILLMDSGKIVERGTHDELYQAGGRYRELCDMQVLDS